jgi:hypothetical protein
MKRTIFLGLAGVALLAGVAMAQSVVNYNEQGGARTVIGGDLDVASGGELDIESGGTLTVSSGATATFSAAPTFAGTVTLDDGSGASPNLVFTDVSDQTATFGKTNQGYLGLTTSAADDGFQVITGSVKIGNGTPDNTPDGEDLYVEGDLEVDGSIYIGAVAMSSTAAELDQAHLTAYLEDISSASSTYVVAPASGNITAVYSVMFGDITTADAVLTVAANGTNVSPATLTLSAVAGSEAGVVDTLAPTEDYAVTAGQVIEIGTDGGSTNDVDAMITIIIDR